MSDTSPRASRPAEDSPDSPVASAAATPDTPAPALRRRLGAGFIAAWAIIAILGLGSLGVSHTAAMPVPEDEIRLASGIAAFAERPGGPAYVHIIDPACSCTAGLLQQLLARGAFTGVHESIVFTGEDPNLREAAERAGFAFHAVTRAELGATLGIEVAPVLVALGADDQLWYIGGYFDKPAAVIARDASIHADLRSGKDVSPLPVFGCAVSERLRDRVDPLGVVYRDE